MEAGISKKILSDKELEALNQEIAKLKKSVDDAINDFSTVIKSFNNQAIVESFYASGKFGEQEQQKLSNLLRLLTKYSNTISGTDGLISETNAYIDDQMNRLQNG